MSLNYITLQDAARVLDLSEKSIRRRIADGTIPAYRLGRAIRIREDDLAAVGRPISSALVGKKRGGS